MNILRGLNKKFIYSFICVGAVGLGWYLLQFRVETTEDINLSHKEASKITAIEPQVGGQQNIADKSNVKSISHEVLLDVDLAEIKAWLKSSEEWRESRGYFSRKDKEVYEGYSDDVLEDLGARGDIKALDVLANRMLIEKGNMKESARYAKMGVVLGSTTALKMLTLFSSPANFSKSQERVAVLETLVIAKLLEMRGDKKMAEFARSDLAVEYKADLALSAQEQAYVDKRARDVYDKFQAIRTEKGLGDFDNSPTSHMGKLFQNK